MKFGKEESIQRIRQVLGFLLKSFAGDPRPLATKITQEQCLSQAC